MKKLTFSKWCEMQYGRNWGEMRREYLAEGIDRHTVEDVFKSGIEEEYSKYCEDFKKGESQ